MARAAGVVVAVALATVFLAGGGGAQPGGEVERLGWLEGRWTGEKDGVSSEEIWVARGGVLLGVHSDVKAGRLASWEFLRIGRTADGAFYFASPRSAPPVAFGLVEQSERRVVFANEQHDFPQRIVYWLDEEGALHARVEGPQGGRTVSEEWTWTKAR